MHQTRSTLCALLLLYNVVVARRSHERQRIEGDANIEVSTLRPYNIGFIAGTFAARHLPPFISLALEFSFIFNLCRAFQPRFGLRVWFFSPYDFYLRVSYTG